MSHFLGSPSLLVLMLVLLSSSLTLSAPSFSSKVTSAELNNVCSKTKNPSFCLGVLKSNPQTPGANLTALCKISIDLTRESATSTHDMVVGLVKSATNPTLKNRYSSCYENYDDAMGNLDDATQRLKDGDYNGVNVAASAVMTYVGDCEDNFQTPPADPSTLPAKNKNMDDLTSILLAISSELAQ